VKGELHGCPQLKEVEKMQCIEAGYVVAPNKIGVQKHHLWIKWKTLPYLEQLC
jgi:hypothetical protein